MSENWREMTRLGKWVEEFYRTTNIDRCHRFRPELSIFAQIGSFGIGATRLRWPMNRVYRGGRVQSNDQYRSLDVSPNRLSIDSHYRFSPRFDPLEWESHDSLFERITLAHRNYSNVMAFTQYLKQVDSIDWPNNLNRPSNFCGLGEQGSLNIHVQGAFYHVRL